VSSTDVPVGRMFGGGSVYLSLQAPSITEVQLIARLCEYKNNQVTPPGKLLKYFLNASAGAGRPASAWFFVLQKASVDMVVPCLLTLKLSSRRAFKCSLQMSA
jgi:hypothetical protein